MNDWSDGSLAPVIAHRGASGYAPENTLVAMRMAAESGARCVELDVAISRDQVAFVHHDNRLDRCTTGSGFLCEHDAQDLDALFANGGNPDYANEPLPRLSAVIDLLVQLKLGLNLEIKPHPGLAVATAEACCLAVSERWPANLPFVFSSFDREALATAQRCLPAAPRALLVGAVTDDCEQALTTLDCRNLHGDARKMTSDACTALTAAGYGVYCYTVNRVEQARALWDIGVNGVFTDFPDQLLAATPA